MGIWHRGQLSGWDSAEIEIAGRICGSKPGWFLFHDGIGKPAWYSRAVVRWNPTRSSLTMPTWYYRRRRKRDPDVHIQTQEQKARQKRIQKRLERLGVDT